MVQQEKQARVSYYNNIQTYKYASNDSLGRCPMIILGKGTVITRDTDRPIIYDGAVVIDGTQIIDIGAYDE